MKLSPISIIYKWINAAGLKLTKSHKTKIDKYLIQKKKRKKRTNKRAGDRTFEMRRRQRTRGILFLIAKRGMCTYVCLKIAKLLPFNIDDTYS